MKQKKTGIIILSLIIAAMLIPVLIGCKYAIPSADDFKFAIGWKNTSDNHFIYIIKNAFTTYMEWQGTHFVNILIGFPVYYALGLGAYRFVCLLAVVLFVFSVMLFFGSVSKWMTEDKITAGLITAVLLAMSLFYIFSNNPLSEVFYWFTGICAYTIPMSFGLICLSSYVLYSIDKKKKHIVTGVVFGIMAGGGSLNIGTFICALLLFAVIYDKLTKGKIEKNVIIGIAALVSTVITVAAPGNFARHASYVDSISPGICVYYSLSRVNTMIAEGFGTGILTVIIVVSFIAGYNIFKNADKKFVYPGLVAFFCYVAPMVILFPVCLGYSSKFIPERCMFIEYFALYIFIVLGTMYFAGWAAGKKLFTFTSVSYLILALICIVPMTRYLDNDTMRELIPVRMFWHIASGDFKRVEARELWLINELEQAADDDVIIYVESGPEGEWTNIKGVGLTDDPAFWLNEGVAGYYGKNSVIVYGNNTEDNQE